MTALHTRLFGLLANSWGILLIYFYYSSRVHKYLAPDFHHLIMLGGIGILVLGTYSLINPKEKKSPCGHDHDHDHEENHSCDDCHHQHQEGHGPLTTTLLTLVPLTIAMTFTQDKLSNTGLSKKGLYQAPNISNGTSADRPPFTRQDLEKRIPKNEHGEFELRMITAYYAAGDQEIQHIFDGLPIQLEGRIAPEKINNERGDRMRIFRSIITCCAADLQVIGVSMEFPEGTTRPKDQDWVKAGGILTFEKIDGTTLPLLKIREVLPAEEPYSEFRLRQ